MLKKLAKTIIAITMVTTLSVTVTPIYNIDAKDNNSEAKQYIETSYKTSFPHNYSGEAAWLNDFELEANPATAGKVILEKYVGTAEDLYIPAKVTIDSTEYDVTVCNQPMFFLNSSLYTPNTTTKSISFDSAIDTSNVTLTSQMFANCTALTRIDMGGFDTNNVTRMSSMFSNCSSLTSLDLSSFDTSAVTGNSMFNMFYNCSSLTSLDVSSFDTSRVTHMNGMFYNCSSLTSLNVSSFDTSYVTDMNDMFHNCSSLTSLDLSNFNTSRVTNMTGIFESCSSLEHLDLSGCALDNLRQDGSYRLINGCTSLQTIETPIYLLKNVDLPGTFHRLDDPSVTFNTLPYNYTSSFTIVRGDYVVPTSISVSPTSKSIGIGASFTIVPTVLPANATDKSVTWTSSAPTIASVDATGKVTGLASGTATITATTNNGGYTANCTVTVSNAKVDVTGISVSPTTRTMNVGEDYHLTATVTPDNATDKSITWSSSDPTVATVNADAIVTALKAGTATITATTNDGGYTATCVITVIGGTVDVTGITVTPTTKALTVGEDFTITSTVTPDNATDKSVTWTTSDDTIATVDANGKVTALKEGTATITATTNDGGFKATCTVTVSATKIDVTGITVTPTSRTMHEGDDYHLTATVTPDNATDKSVIWTSSDDTIATVDDNGNVTALKEGTATITATTNDGGFTASCVITVIKREERVTGITVTPISKTANVGEIFFVTPYITPVDAEDKSVTWSSSNPSIATVDSNGKVTAIREGVVTITATTNDGGLKATCTVTVVDSTVDVHRFYNPISGEHLFTSNDGEHSYLTAIGWNYEGVAWTAPYSSNRPVYRVFNPYTGEHHYTANSDEIFWLLISGWNDEGICWYSVNTNTRGTPVYRLFNPYIKGIGAHHYTANTSERDYLISLGWNYEGIGWYGL